MSYYFIDSSALVKRYVPEIGTNWLNTIVSPQAGNNILVAQITPAEIVSSAARRNREGIVTIRTVHAIRLVVNRHASREYLVVELTPALVSRAQDLLIRYPLRAYDAIQLASALEAYPLLASKHLPHAFIAADVKLLSAASSEGLSVDDPNSHP